MYLKYSFLFIGILFILATSTQAQETKKSHLTLDRIYNSNEFKGESQRPISWVDDGSAFITIEKNSAGADELVKYLSKNKVSTRYLSAKQLTPDENGEPLSIVDFRLSKDGSKVLIFTNTSRVWRSNTKGDYWVYDFVTKTLSQIGKELPSSSLMFAKFSDDNAFVGYVSGFNLYKEDFKSGTMTRLTEDGDSKIINGTFDWVYEEEFGARDGFSWSPDTQKIAFWQLNASEIGTFYMINNTDSVYSEPLPLQYPKVGYDPSAAKVGLIDAQSGNTTWIPMPGDAVQHYIPAMQWVDNDLLLIQQLNRKQNMLNIFTYRPSIGELKKVYTETEKTWVDLGYPDISSDQWGDNELLLVDSNTAFIRMTETDGWRHLYKVDITSGKRILLTPGEYDVAAFYAATSKEVYFSASPENPTQRYLYKTNLNGQGKPERITPDTFQGVNTYRISPNGRYAIHHHTNIESPKTTRLINLPDHKIISQLVDNKELISKLKSLDLPKTEFFSVTTADGIDIDGRMTKPVDFDSSKKYPVLFHVYGEPWGQVATDTWIGLYDIFLAQKGFVVVNMDNRGTPSLKGSEWRKSIYRKVGVLNTRDQAQAAEEVLKREYLDKDRVSVWGWSGGGSMTLNLMFRYPEIYKTGMAVAAVANQLFYDNVYQERYMGLPQENREDFIKGSPVTYAKNLKGNLLVVHGTGDDNVHYQNMEYLVNELIRQNKKFTMMAYPNRSHGIYEGENTRRHLFTLLTDYLLEHNGTGE